MTRNNEKKIFLDAFPNYLTNNVQSIFEKIDFKITLDSSETFIVFIENQQLHIPVRIYYNEIKEDKLKNISEKEKYIIYCYFSRHHDGYIRENMLKHIINLNETWSIPYVLQLIGEYVIEILDIIYSNIDSMNKDKYNEFIINNSDYFKKLKDKVVSYWNCYYRYKYNNFKDYVGYKIINYLESL